MFLNTEKKTRQQREAKGRLAENWASLFLQLKGYRVLKRRFQNPMGEVDLILKKGRTLIFCEVKARHSLDKGLEALAPFQQKRITNGARYFQCQHSQFNNYDCRFDYIIVNGLRCYHLKNAWQA